MNHLCPNSFDRKDSDLKIKLHGKRPYETDAVKYLEIQIDKSLDRNNGLFMWQSSQTKPMLCCKNYGIG